MNEEEREEIEGSIREQAAAWLEDGEIDYLIGYEEGTDAELARPVFIDSPEDVDRLVWNQGCVNNLTLFMIDRIREEDDSRIGIVVKPCDSKTIVELMKENVLDRERIKIIGVTCEGVIDTDKYDEESGEYGFADECEVCTTHNPVIADEVFGEKVEGEYTDDFDDLKEIEEMDPEERWEYWKDELSRCVRCYACRDACPMCYCEECVFEREKPYEWLEKSVTAENNFFYHMIRGMHLAGRCIDCGECERACPMDIPVRKINRVLYKKVLEKFDVEPGKDIEDESLFGSYDKEDPGEVIL